MTNPTTDAPWWNMLVEIIGLPALDALLPFVLAGILAVGLVALGAMVKRIQNRPPSPE
jgi:hypothetical protein